MYNNPDIVLELALLGVNTPVDIYHLPVSI